MPSPHDTMGLSTMRSKTLDLFDDLLLFVAPSFVWFCAGSCVFMLFVVSCLDKLLSY